MTSKVFPALVRLIPLALAFAASQAFPGASHAQVIVNGSFELGTIAPDVPGHLTLSTGSAALDGWTVEAGSIDVTNDILWLASDGTRSLDMAGGGEGTIWQEVETEVGVEYTLLFDMAGNYAGGPTVKELRVSVPGTQHSYLFSVNGRGPTNMGWRTRSRSRIERSLAIGPR